MHRLFPLLIVTTFFGCAHLHPKAVATESKYSFAYEVSNQRQIEVLQVFSDMETTYIQRYYEPKCTPLKVYTPKGKLLLTSSEQGVLKIKGLYQNLRVTCGHASGDIQPISSHKEEEAG